MRIKLGGFSDAHRHEPPSVARRQALEAGIREARLDVARRNQNWEEVEEPVRRERYLVDAESDRLFRPYRGDMFPTGSASPLTPEIPLSFYVGRDDEVRFLEAVSSPATWSDVGSRRVKRRVAT